MCRKTLCAALIVALFLCPPIFIAANAEEPAYTGNEEPAGRQYEPVDVPREVLPVSDEETSEPEEWEGFYFEQEPKQVSEGILNVVFPASYNFVIDPLNYFGYGQVFSDEYLIENLGRTGIVITITDFSIIFPDDTGYAALAAPFDTDSEDSRKAIYLELHFTVPGEEPVIISSAGQDGYAAIHLEGYGGSASVSSVSVTGSVNPNPAEKWQMGDVRISLSYRVDAAVDYLPDDYYIFEEEEVDEDDMPYDEDTLSAEDGQFIKDAAENEDSPGTPPETEEIIDEDADEDADEDTGDTGNHDDSYDGENLIVDTAAG